MDSAWKSSFGRSRTPMGTVPISVIYGYKYPLSPVTDKSPQNKKISNSSYKAAPWPSCLNTISSTSTTQPPQVVPTRKFRQTETNGVADVSNNIHTASDKLTTTNDCITQKKTRGCLSFISSIRSRQAEELPVSVNPTTSSFNATTYSFRKPNLISSRSRTVDPNYSSHTSYSGLNSFRSSSRAPTVGPTSYSSYSTYGHSYAGLYSRSNVARSQDHKPSSTWYRPSRFTMSSITSSFSRFRTTFQSFRSKYF